MNKQALTEAIRQAGGQAKLARRINMSQARISEWLNSDKPDVPPARAVLTIAREFGFTITPHQLRPDLYPNPADALPPPLALQVALGAWPPGIGQVTR